METIVRLRGNRNRSYITAREDIAVCGGDLIVHGADAGESEGGEKGGGEGEKLHGACWCWFKLCLVGRNDMMVFTRVLRDAEGKRDCSIYPSVR